MGLFKKKFDEFDRLMACTKVLEEKIKIHLTGEEFSKINPIEFYLLIGAFNATCYITFRDNPSKKLLFQLANWTTMKIIDEFVVKQTPRTPETEIERLHDGLMKAYQSRFSEYLNLLEKEYQKNRGTSSFVDLTTGVLNRLHDSNKPAEEIFDPLFAMILVEHTNNFCDVMDGKYG